MLNCICNTGYNLGQNCWENCILGERFSKHHSCTGSSIFPFPWKQCCCVLKRKPDPWVFVGSNSELGEGDFFPQRHRLKIVLLCRKVDMMGKTFSSSFGIVAKRLQFRQCVLSLPLCPPCMYISLMSFVRKRVWYIFIQF